MPFPIPIPSVVETTARGRESWDLFSRLLKDRILFLGWPIDDFASTAIIAQMLFLQLENKDQDVNVYLNCPGGWSNSILAVYDTMQFVTNDVQTYCIGECSRDAVLLLAAGEKGKRYSLPHSRVMLHQPFAQIGFAQASRIQRHAEEIVFIKRQGIKLLAKHCGRTEKEVEDACERETFLSPEQAKQFGIIDHIVDSETIVQAAAEKR
jgi:ATP-dependent Clp protease, protease subunit